MKELREMTRKEMLEKEIEHRKCNIDNMMVEIEHLQEQLQEEIEKQGAEDGQ